MEIFCTRPGCVRPLNHFSELDESNKLKTEPQKYCTSCGMPLILGGRYLPLKLLGQGGFGTAFLARDRYTPTMRNCVVKQFQPSGNLGPQELKIAQELFEREATVLEQLGNEHKQIPYLYAFFPEGEQHQYFYLVQEFIDGQNLEEELQTKGSFSEAEVEEVLVEILNLLQFVHSHGSIHRDIKPSNIMRRRDGRLYLLDFGAVKQVAGTGGSPGRSTGIYSPGFAPPEQMAGSQVYPSTDLYALAVTCINLLTGQPSENLYDSFHSIWKWRHHVPDVSQQLVAVLDRMLQTSPKERFQSAQEVLAALQPTQVSVSNSPQTQPQPFPSPPQSPVMPTPGMTPNSFGLSEILISAGFTGFEGALLLIAITQLPLPSPGLSLGLWGMAMGAIIYAQYSRIIENLDPWILAVISLLLVWFVPVLRGSLEQGEIIIIAILAGAGAIGITAIFRLIYQILYRIM